MKVINKERIARRRGEVWYRVTVDKWTNTTENRNAIYDICDKWNFGGFIESTSKTPDGYVLSVCVYID